MSTIVTLIPDDALLADVVESAACQHLHILSNGRRTVLSPVVLDGWTKVRVAAVPVKKQIPTEEQHAAA